MARKNTSIEKKSMYRLYTTLTVYTLAGYALCIIGEYVTIKFPNPIFLWIDLRNDIIYFIYIIIGFSCIFHYYWKKPWSYLEEVIHGTKTVYNENNSTIELSEPLKDIEKQMNQIKMSMILSHQAAKDAENKKNELVMYIAHDIRTPLTSVIGYLSLLHEASDMPVEQKAKYVGIALEKAQRLEQLINEFFEITRYNTAQIRIKKVEIDLYYMLAQLMEEFYPVLSAKGNTATLNAAEDLIIYGDAEKLARVFNNILKNAVAYSYPNTEIIISAMMDKDIINITFQNYGKNIDNDKLPHIFEKFTRLDDARKSDTGGAGLGLSIAKEIICLHSGTIDVHSENDTITFKVSIPHMP